MKKILCAFLSVLMLAGLFAGCDTSRTPKSAEQFRNQMEAEGFTIVDVTDEVGNSMLTNGLVAEGKDFQLEFYVFSTNEIGEQVYNENVRMFKEEYTNGTSSSMTASNYNYFRYTTEEKFLLVSQIDNTMIWCSVDKACKDEVIRLVEALGY